MANPRWVSIRSCPGTSVRCWPATSTVAAGSSTRSHTSTPATHAEVPAALERSRSGDGAHVWVFFDGPIPAATARSLGTSLLREAMMARAELDLSSYDRFFPSQDFMPKGSFGNLIALPLHGERLHRPFLSKFVEIPVVQVIGERNRPHVRLLDR